MIKNVFFIIILFFNCLLIKSQNISILTIRINGNEIEINDSVEIYLYTLDVDKNFKKLRLNQNLISVPYKENDTEIRFLVIKCKGFYFTHDFTDYNTDSIPWYGIDFYDSDHFPEERYKFDLIKKHKKIEAYYRVSLLGISKYYFIKDIDKIKSQPDFTRRKYYNLFRNIIIR